MTEKIQSARDFACRFVPQKFEELRARFATQSLPGSVALNVVGEDAWSFRIQDGALSVASGLEADRFLTVTLASDDFSRVIAALPLPSESKAAEPTATEPKAAALGLKFLSWDTETVNLVRALPGSILLRFDDQGTARRILLTPAARSLSFEEAACTIDCAWADWIDLQTGKQQPMDLFLAGKIRLSGNAELALALAGVLL